MQVREATRTPAKNTVLKLFSFVFGPQLTAHRIGTQVDAFLESRRLFLYHKRLAGHPELEFYHFILLVGSVEQMQIHLGIDHTVVEKFQLVEFLLNELQQFHIRFEMDGLRKYFHDGNVLRPSLLGMLVPAGMGLVIH